MTTNKATTKAGRAAKSLACVRCGRCFKREGRGPAVNCHGCRIAIKFEAQAKAKKRAAELGERAIKARAAKEVRPCDWCKKPLPAGCRKGRRWCSKLCCQMAYLERKKPPRPASSSRPPTGPRPKVRPSERAAAETPKTETGRPIMYPLVAPYRPGLVPLPVKGADGRWRRPT